MKNDQKIELVTRLRDDIKVGVEVSPSCPLVHPEDPDIVGPFATYEEADKWQKEHLSTKVSAMPRLKPLEEWICDTCRQSVSIADGWVEWRESVGRGPRFSYRAPSPRVLSAY